MNREGLCQVFKIEELKRYGQYRISAESLGRQNKYTVTFLSQNKDDYPIGTWVTVGIAI